jgi:hypothetical protein
MSTLCLDQRKKRWLPAPIQQLGKGFDPPRSQEKSHKNSWRSSISVGTIFRLASSRTAQRLKRYLPPQNSQTTPKPDFLPHGFYWRNSLNPNKASTRIRTGDLLITNQERHIAGSLDQARLAIRVLCMVSPRSVAEIEIASVQADQSLIRRSCATGETHCCLPDFPAVSHLRRYSLRFGHGMKRVRNNLTCMS